MICLGTFGNGVMTGIRITFHHPSPSIRSDHLKGVAKCFEAVDGTHLLDIFELRIVTTTVLVRGQVPWASAS
jgi:hypothetical protein